MADHVVFARTSATTLLSTLHLPAPHRTRKSAIIQRRNVASRRRRPLSMAAMALHPNERWNYIFTMNYRILVNRRTKPSTRMRFVCTVSFWTGIFFHGNNHNSAIITRTPFITLECGFVRSSVGPPPTGATNTDDKQQCERTQTRDGGGP